MPLGYLTPIVELAKLLFDKSRVPVLITCVILTAYGTFRSIAPAALVSAQPYLGSLAVFLGTHLIYDHCCLAWQRRTARKRRREQLSKTFASLSYVEKRLLNAALGCKTTTLSTIATDTEYALALCDKGIVREVFHSRENRNAFIIEDDAWEYMQTIGDFFPDGPLSL